LIPYSDVETLADSQGIYLRSGGLCNPGGIASHLHLEPWEMKRAYAAGHRCGHATQIMFGKPTGVVRVSLGAMTIRSDVDRFLNFMTGYLVESLGTGQSSVTQSPVVVGKADLDVVRNTTVHDPLKALDLSAREPTGPGLGEGWWRSPPRLARTEAGLVIKSIHA